MKSFNNNRFLGLLPPREITQHLDFFNRLATAADIELPIDVVQVFLYDVRRNDQLSSNFLVLYTASPFLV